MISVENLIINPDNIVYIAKVSGTKIDIVTVFKTNTYNYSTEESRNEQFQKLSEALTKEQS